MNKLLFHQHSVPQQQFRVDENQTEEQRGLEE